MGERKVVNKFIPWNFDPEKACKVKLSNIGQFSVRMMLPFTVKCNACGEFMYAGKKFNTRKETANGEDYLGIAIERFYFKCVNCGSEFAIKTDPKSGGYVVEYGATQNAYIHMNERQLELEEKRLLEEAEGIDAIKALENRTEESKHEMDIYDALDTLQAQQRRTMNTDPEEALSIIRSREETKKQAEMQSQQEKKEDMEKELSEAIKRRQEEALKKSEEYISNIFSKPSKPASSKNSHLPHIKVVPRKKKSSAKPVISVLVNCIV